LGRIGAPEPGERLARAQLAGVDEVRRLAAGLERELAEADHFVADEELDEGLLVGLHERQGNSSIALQPDHEARSRSAVAAILGADRALVGGGDLAAQIQPEPDAALVAGARRVESRERLEDVRALA